MGQKVGKRLDAYNLYPTKKSFQSEETTTANPHLKKENRKPKSRKQNSNKDFPDFQCRLPNLGHEAALDYLQAQVQKTLRRNQEYEQRLEEWKARKRLEKIGKLDSETQIIQNPIITPHSLTPSPPEVKDLGWSGGEMEKNDFGNFEKPSLKHGEAGTDEEEDETEILEKSLRVHLDIPKLESEVQQERIRAAIQGAAIGTFAILTAVGIQAALTNTFETLMPAKEYRFVYLYLLAFLYITLLIFCSTFFVA